MIQTDIANRDGNIERKKLLFWFFESLIMDEKFWKNVFVDSDKFLCSW